MPRGERDNLELIWSIAELAGLFGRKTNVGGFLQDVVELIADHMGSDVCSIYLYDQSAERLVLRATRGLDISDAGQISLMIGEGITGAALKELRPIREARASRHPSFKSVPGLEESQFESFLAVPIKRGLTRIGAMVLQHRKPAYFTGADVRAMQAIASQLAATLENVEILMEIRGGEAHEHKPRKPGKATHMAGVSASEGVGEGQAYVFGRPSEYLPASLDSQISGEDAEDRFDSALEQTQAQLESLQEELGDEMSDVAALIFNSHLLMLKDEEFTGEMKQRIQSGSEAGQAIVDVVNHYVSIFDRSENPRIKEKAQDVKDLGHRLLQNMVYQDEQKADYRGQVVIARELYPSELLKIAAQHAEGLVLFGAGLTAHISILARSLGLPVVLVRDERVFDVTPGTRLLVDAHRGNVYVNPDEELAETVRTALHTFDASVQVPPRKTCRTRDGEQVTVMANANIVHDVRLAISNKADGIGLYRSEFPFIIRNDFPSEDEQFAVYRRIVTMMDGRVANLRTLDIGGDKILSHRAERENNPFLGLRGIRFSLANIDLFSEQLRALLRAGAGTDLRILLPMISSVDEIRAVRSVLRDCIADLENDGVACNDHPVLGAMIELPSAVESIRGIAAEVDFLSIGTNDLVMYMLAVDRTNQYVGGMYKHHHPAVLQALWRVAEAAQATATDLSVCGNAAADPDMLPFFLGIGVRSLSVDPRLVPGAKQAIAALDAREAQKVAADMLKIDSLAEIEEYLTGIRESRETPAPQPGV